MPLDGFEIKTSSQSSTVSDAEASGGSVYAVAALRGRVSTKYVETRNKNSIDAGSVTMAEGDNKSANMLVSINQIFRSSEFKGLREFGVCLWQQR